MSTAKPCCVLIIELNLERSWKPQFSAAVTLSRHGTQQGHSGCGLHGNALEMGHLTVPFPVLLFSQQPPSFLSTSLRSHGSTATRGCSPPGPAARLLSTHTALSRRGRLPSSYSASTNAQLSFTTVPTLAALINSRNG